MKKLPLGIQTFSEIIKNDYIYIDKTDIILSLLEISKYFFLSRPRRFGKSLLLSTLKEIFLGNKELFTGLYIHDKIEWKEHPVFHIDFSTLTYDKTPEIFEQSLSAMIEKHASKYDISLEMKNIKDKFAELLEKLSVYNKVVVLIDEYDKPIIDFITEPEKAQVNRDILRNFFSVLKSSDQYLRFVFLTGVSKFSKVSLFSGMNNIFDITLDNRFATLLGITKEELLGNFGPYLTNLASIEGISENELVTQIQTWYNGYSWDGEHRVFNPISLLSLFSVNRFDNYWFTTATPTFLIKTMEQYNYPIVDIENTKVGKNILDSSEIDELDVTSLLFQTGYLTVKDVTRRRNHYIYTLGCPNYEVKDSLLNYIFASYIKEPASKITPLYVSLVDALEDKNLDDFITIIKSMFAKIPYNLQLKNEAYFHSLFYLMLSLMGVKINLEVLTDKGRMDGVLELDNCIYIIELKRGTPQEAIDQIDDRRYYEPYIDSKKEIFLLGIGGFDAKNIDYICRKI